MQVTKIHNKIRELKIRIIWKQFLFLQIIEIL